MEHRLCPQALFQIILNTTSRIAASVAATHTPVGLTLAATTAAASTADDDADVATALDEDDIE